MNLSSFIFTLLVATATATKVRLFDKQEFRLSDKQGNTRRAPLVACPSQDEIFEIVNQPQLPGTYEYGLQCDFDYIYTGTSANDLKCTPSTMCSYNDDDTWQCVMASFFCDPGIEYEDDQVQCGDVCGPVKICPSEDEIFEIVNQPQLPGTYEYGLQCDFEYIYTGTSANDLKCTPSTMCSYNDDDTWQCAMYGIFCDPEIEYEDEQVQCGDVCEPNEINELMSRMAATEGSLAASGSGNGGDPVSIMKDAEETDVSGINIGIDDSAASTTASTIGSSIAGIAAAVGVVALL